MLTPWIAWIYNILAYNPIFAIAESNRRATNDAMTDTSRDTPDVIIFPPLIPLLVLVVGLSSTFLCHWACSPMFYSWDGS
jgi:hypothetical protein